MHSRLVLAALFLLAAACQPTLTLDREGSLRSLSKDARVFVALPADGRDASMSYAGSGALTLDAVQDAFKRHVARVDGGTYVDSRDGALEEGRRLGCSLVVVPEILHWEDQQTELSVASDELEVRLILVDAESGATIDQVTLGSTSWPFTLHGARPEDMLAQSVGEYVDSLF